MDNDILTNIEKIIELYGNQEGYSMPMGWYRDFAVELKSAREELVKLKQPDMGIVIGYEAGLRQGKEQREKAVEALGEIADLIDPAYDEDNRKGAYDIAQQALKELE